MESTDAVPTQVGITQISQMEKANGQTSQVQRGGTGATEAVAPSGPYV